MVALRAKVLIYIDRYSNMDVASRTMLLVRALRNVNLFVSAFILTEYIEPTHEKTI